MSAFLLSVEPAFSQHGAGLNPVQHIQRYGLDLSWVVATSRGLRCSLCGARVRLSAEQSLTITGVICAAFIEQHSDCVRVRTKPGRAS